VDLWELVLTGFLFDVSILFSSRSRLVSALVLFVVDLAKLSILLDPSHSSNRQNSDFDPPTSHLYRLSTSLSFSNLQRAGPKCRSLLLRPTSSSSTFFGECCSVEEDYKDKFADIEKSAEHQRRRQGQDYVRP